MILLLIVFGAITIYYCYHEFTRSSRLLKTIPGPRRLPILGNALEFATLDKKALWDYLQNISNKYYPRAKISVFTKSVIFLRDPKDLQIYLTSPINITKGLLYTYFEDWLSDGIFTATGKRWRTQRKVVAPGFSFNALIRTVKIINKYAEKAVDGLRSKGKENDYELKNLLSELVLTSSFPALGDIDRDNVDEKIIHNFIEAVEVMTDIIASRLLHPYLPRWYYFNKFTSYGRKNLASIDGFNNITQELQRKYNLDDHNSVSLVKQGILEKTDTTNDNFPLALIINAERDGIFNRREVEVFINSAFFGVYDTTRVSLSFTLLLLAEHKEIQDRARAEVTGVLEENGGKLESAELKKLNYLELCIKESLRMFPVAPMMSRYTEEDVQLENQVIPAGTDVIFRIFDLHRDPKYWPEPDKYDPERFLPERIKNQHPFAYLPFSAGPRNCLGQKYAMVSMKSIVGRILYNFYLEPIDHVEDLTYIADIMLSTTVPFRAKFIRIDRD